MNELKSTDNNQNHYSLEHIAIIMDGNGRWAKQRGKFRITGHRAGLHAVRRAVKFAAIHGVKALTLYAFSSENWDRPANEVVGLMQLFTQALDKEVVKLHKNNVKLQVIGDISRFSTTIQNKISRAQQLTVTNTGLILNIAANYGGKWDIIHAVNRIISAVRQGELRDVTLTEQQFNQYISLADLPPVDLMIRTGGECRLSNFMLWQSAYAELYFTETLWPDFDDNEFKSALEAYHARERRFGSVIDA